MNDIGKTLENLRQEFHGVLDNKNYAKIIDIGNRMYSELFRYYKSLLAFKKDLELDRKLFLQAGMKKDYLTFVSENEKNIDIIMRKLKSTVGLIELIERDLQIQTIQENSQGGSE